MQYTDIISKRSVNKNTHKILLIQKKNINFVLCNHNRKRNKA